MIFALVCFNKLNNVHIRAFVMYRPLSCISSAFSMVFHWTTFAIELLGRVVFNSVLLAVVVNYVTQCEMVMFYVKGLTLRLQEKSADIKTAFKVHHCVSHNASWSALVPIFQFILDS